MTGQMYEIVLTATGEVRDADGNLISAEPVEATWQVTAEQLAELTQGEDQ
jgi:hypothetical protein